jgi:hypothetical protein
MGCEAMQVFLIGVWDKTPPLLICYLLNSFEVYMFTILGFHMVHVLLIRLSCL